MSDLRQLIRREIKRRQEFITGRVLTEPNLLQFGLTPGTESTWVVDVDIGSNRRLESVPVKTYNRRRTYASVGSTVLLRRSTQGRYEVVGPGDRKHGTLTTTKYVIDVVTPQSSADAGFSSRLETFIWYATAGSGGSSAWADGVTPFPKRTVIDADGNPV